MKPYFGPDLRANQCLPVRSRHFATLVALTQPVIILEVGSWAGQSLVEWDKAAGGRARLIAVDQWLPYFTHIGDPYDEMNRAAATGEIFELFRSNIRAAGVEDRVIVWQGDSRDVLPELAKTQAGLIDIVFVDGNHRYEYVKQDIINSQVLVRDGGILCGDDLERSMESVVDMDSHRMAIEKGLDTVYDYHPGVTQAVDELLGRVTMLDGLWAVQRRGANWCQL